MAAVLMVLQAVGLAAAARFAAGASADPAGRDRYRLRIVPPPATRSVLSWASCPAACCMAPPQRPPAPASIGKGALAMAAFAVGTMPALIAVGWGGLFLRRRLHDVGRSIAPPLLIANATLMLALASNRL